MKKYWILLLICGFIVSCADDKSSEKTQGAPTGSVAIKIEWQQPKSAVRATSCSICTILEYRLKNANGKTVSHGTFNFGTHTGTISDITVDENYTITCVAWNDYDTGTKIYEGASAKFQVKSNKTSNVPVVMNTTVDADADQDGYIRPDLVPAAPDCDDANSVIHPGNPVECANCVDDDGWSAYYAGEGGLNPDSDDPGCTNGTITYDPLDTSENDALLPCDDGADGDGWGDSDADDPGCDGPADANETNGALICDNGVDSPIPDYDALVDANDPGCASPADTTETSNTVECDDGFDTPSPDMDTLVDINDPGCDDPSDTSELGTNECDDGVDSPLPDYDALVDVNDPGCGGDPSGTSELGTNQCDDGNDNDSDGLEDINDPGCFNDPAGLTEIGDCQDNMNNDLDTYKDYPEDPGCASLADITETSNSLICDNGDDDDGDTFTDWPADPGCDTVYDPIETEEAWIKLDTSTPRPDGRWMAAMDFDPNFGRVVVFAGANGVEGSRGTTHYNDVWSLTLQPITSPWSQLSPSAPFGSPPVLYGAFGSYSIDNNETIFVGGHRNYEVDVECCEYPAGSKCCHDQDCDGRAHYSGWTLDFTGNLNGIWNELPAEFPQRYGESGAYDSVNLDWYIFGGKRLEAEYVSDCYGGGLCGCPFCYCCDAHGDCGGGQTYYYDDLYLFDGSSVQNLGAIQTGDIPTARAWHSAVYDSVRNRILVYGGYPEDADVYSLDLSTPGVYNWTLLTPSAPAGAPDARWKHGAVYDPISDRMVIYGGNSSSGRLDDTWVLVFTPGDSDGFWKELAPGGFIPSPREGISYAWDSINGQMIIFGGYDGATYQNEVYVLK